MQTDKPFSQACENNKHAILEHLKVYFRRAKRVLEIGSGTGQHAVFFAENLTHLEWQCSDQADYLPGINQWIDEYPSPNLHRPIEFTIRKDFWPHASNTVFDAVFTANTAHIMQKEEVKAMMEMLDQHLPQNGIFCQYGPFKVGNQFTSVSNQAFHERLIESGRGGYRDLSELTKWASNLHLVKTIEMPANNFLLVWHKKT